MEGDRRNLKSQSDQDQRQPKRQHAEHDTPLNRVRLVMTKQSRGSNEDVDNHRRRLGQMLVFAHQQRDHWDDDQ